MTNASRALLVFALALAAYWGTALVFGNDATPDVAYFNVLADAFLHGRTYLVAPPATHDLTAFQGRWYVPFPPLPALLMLPWVWGLGLARVNTVFFCAFFGALNVTLVFFLLEALTQRGWSKVRGAKDNLWLTLLFGLGSVHWYMATLGSVWFVAQICTVTFVLLAVWLAIWAPWQRATPWIAGGTLALALLARPNVIFTWPLLLGVGLQHGWSPVKAQESTLHSSDQLYQFEWRSLPYSGFATMVPLVLALALLLAYNWIRFANPFDFGYLSENVAKELAANLHTYGQFHFHYLPKNLWAMWLAGPQWNAKYNFWQPDPEGMSLLLTTPALIYLARARRRDPLTLGAWAAFVLLLVPLLLYYNTGWWQFGYRFSLDFMTPVMILLALAAGTGTSRAFRVLILVGVVVNLGGVVWWHWRERAY